MCLNRLFRQHYSWQKMLFLTCESWIARIGRCSSTLCANSSDIPCFLFVDFCNYFLFFFLFYMCAHIYIYVCIPQTLFKAKMEAHLWISEGTYVTRWKQRQKQDQNKGNYHILDQTLETSSRCLSDVQKECLWNIFYEMLWVWDLKHDVNLKVIGCHSWTWMGPKKDGQGFHPET